MVEGIKMIQTQNDVYYLKHEGEYLNAFYDKEAKGNILHSINMGLLYRIAVYTSVRRSYKAILLKFYDDLFGEFKKGNLRQFFQSKENLENAGRAVGKPGGYVAFLLGLFCRYYNKNPRNINFVYYSCEKCRNDKAECGTLDKCGDYYGCGKGVSWPLAPGFDIKTIPGLRKNIEMEKFTNS